MSGFPGSRQTYLYAVHCPQRGVKLGVSCKPKRRATALKGELLAITFGDHRQESELHDLLAVHAIGREWYRDCPAVRAVLVGWHEPDWLDRGGGAWMPSGSFLLDASLLDEDYDHPYERQHHPAQRTGGRRRTLWDERDSRKDKYADPLALDGQAA